MNKINLGPNLTLADSSVNMGDIFMIEHTGENQWYSPYMMVRVDDDGWYLVGIKDGNVFSGIIFYHPTKDEVCDSVSDQGNYECSYVGSCNITIERR